MKDKVIHVIPHTHWDFEWYFTRHEAFVQFCYHMDEVLAALENNTIHYYLLDGQMSILDDYIAAFPEKKATIRRFVEAKRLFIGPWYTQTDELIVSGESILRNLNLGMDEADELGGAMMVGYLPDSFGQGKDMPKIYNGLGIKYGLFWRGVPVDKVKGTEFNWAAEDGSSVLVENIKNGYFAGVPVIEADQSADEAVTYIGELTKDAATANTALPIGGDQRYVDFNLEEKIAKLNTALASAGSRALESNYPALFASIEAEGKTLETVTGEFVDPSVSKIHRSIYSSRYDHKYLNDKLERRMLYELEPLMTLADSYGIAYHKELLDKIWTLMVRNHAHDSAGGCNSDKTNRDILNRLIEADQLSYSALDYLTRKLAISLPDAQENDLLLFNPLPSARTKTFTVKLSLKTPGLKLEDGAGPVAFDLLDTERVYAGSIQRNPADNDPDNYYYVHTVRLNVNLSPMAFTKIAVVPVTAAGAPIEASHTADTMENAQYAIEFTKGHLNLYDKRADKRYADILTFEDGGDEGDTYDYSPAYQDRVYSLNLAEARAEVKVGQLAQTMTLSGTWQVPGDLQKRAEGVRDAELTYRLLIQLTPDDSDIEFKLHIDNQARDHRVRARLNVDLPVKEAVSDSQFGTVARPVVDPHGADWRELNYHEEPSTLYAMLHYVNLHDETRSATVMTKGIKEYQVVGEHNDQLALTLYRSVGFLGRPDLIRRPGKASGNEFRYIPTPDSQLLGELTFKFALRLEAAYDASQIMRAYQNYAARVLYHQNQKLNLFTSTLQYFVMNRLPLSSRQTPSIQVPDTLVLSSLHKTPDATGMVVRVYNPSATETLAEAVIELSAPAKIATLDLRDRSQTGITVAKQIHCGTMKPGEIKTFGIY